MTDASLVRDVEEAAGAISAQLRLRFASGTTPDLGFVALATLRHLVRRGPRSLSELARADRVTTQAISLRIRPLLDAGLITRSVDPNDARRGVVSVTDDGRRVVDSAAASSHDALDVAIGGLTGGERDLLAAAVPVLRQIVAALAQELR
ncbi:MAG TPA: MarR family transcriptional regulator [Nocardioidaceae bacterium]|nr:MarR family transcriptional regulator [Nocardioidaceae bacterium]